MFDCVTWAVQDWVAAEELHSSAAPGGGSGHYVMYWELREAALQALLLLQGAPAQPGPTPMHARTLQPPVASTQAAPWPASRIPNQAFVS